MPEEHPTITSSVRITPTELSRHSFGIVRRGFDPQEVRSFLDQVARELESWERREQDLRHEIIEAERRAEHPVVDEATLRAGLGAQSAQVLRNAHDEAARIMSQAEESAANLLRDAQQNANDIQIRAESAAAERTAEAELAVGVVAQETHAQSEALLAQATEQGAGIVEASRTQGREMIDQAQIARKKILSDLARRRRTLLVQIEQFRAARDELSAMVANVRDSFDVVIADLARADENARNAAAAAETRANAELPEVEPADDDEVAPDVAAHIEPETEPEPARVPRPAVVFVDRSFGDTEAAADEEPEVEENDDLASVDELFARIRASQEGVKREPPPTAEHPVVAPPDPPAAVAPAAPESFEAQGVRVVAAPTLLIDEPPVVPAEDKRAIDARAVVLDPIAAKLAKRLKRALQDDQNRLLDNIRGAANGSSADMLISEDEQRSYFQDASREVLVEAVAAGVTSAREKRGGAKIAPGADATIAGTMSGELAGVIVSMLRRPLADTTSLRRDDEDLIDRVSAAYREWRGERVERLVGDFAVGAFSAGVLAGTGTRRSVRWVLSGDGEACADCDDNSLAGAVQPGADFPTGHQHPPAHAGCRCLVVPTPS